MGTGEARILPTTHTVTRHSTGSQATGIGNLGDRSIPFLFLQPNHGSCCLGHMGLPHPADAQNRVLMASLRCWCEEEKCHRLSSGTSAWRTGLLWMCWPHVNFSPEASSFSDSSSPSPSFPLLPPPPFSLLPCLPRTYFLVSCGLPKVITHPLWAPYLPNTRPITKHPLAASSSIYHPIGLMPYLLSAHIHVNSLVILFGFYFIIYKCISVI